MDGAVQESDTCVLPGVAVRPVGMPGTVRGMEMTSLLFNPYPTALCAETVKEYEWPLVRPEMLVVVPVRT